MYQWSCSEIHSKVSASSSGDFDYTTGFFGLILLANDHWNDTSGSSPYRLSINKLRDHSIDYLNARIYAPVEEMNMDGTPNDGSAEDSNPNDQTFVKASLENWEICTAAMFLAEYRLKTGDTAIDSPLQLASDLLTNRVQDYQQPPEYDGSPGVTRIGMMGHSGGTIANLINAGVK